MRTIICGIVLASLVAGCTKPADNEVVQVPESGSAPATAAVDDTAVDDTAVGDTAVDDTAASQVESIAEESVTPAVLKVGDAAPAFTELVGVDDQIHSLDEFKAAKVVAVVFTCNKCPVAVLYEDRLNAYQKDYADKGVQVVAINVNNAEADKLPAMKVRAEEKGFAFPYLYDESQKSAREYGAEVTPHFFLLDSERKVVFKGPMDDNPDGTQVTKSYLREATDAVLEGKAVETTDVKPAGCGIQYE